jgi:hypothetical protein
MTQRRSKRCAKRSCRGRTPSRTAPRLVLRRQQSSAAGMAQQDRGAAHLCSVVTAAVRALAAVRYASASDRASFTSHSCSSSSVPSRCCCRAVPRCSASSWRCRAASWRRAPRRPSRSASASAPASSASSPSASRSAAAAESGLPAAAAVSAASRASAGAPSAKGGGVSCTARRALLPPAVDFPSDERSASRRDAASCSVSRSGEGEPGGEGGSSPHGERMPDGVLSRLAGVDASGVLPLLPPR